MARRPSNITGVICIPFSRHYPDSCSVVLCKSGGTLCFCASTGAPRSSWLASTKTARICSDRAGPPSNVHAVGPVIGPFTPKIQTLGKRPTLVVFAGVRLVGHVCEEIASECVHVDVMTAPRRLRPWPLVPGSCCSPGPCRPRRGDVRLVDVVQPPSKNLSLWGPGKVVSIAVWPGFVERIIVIRGRGGPMKRPLAAS